MVKEANEGLPVTWRQLCCHGTVSALALLLETWGLGPFRLLFIPSVFFIWSCGFSNVFQQLEEARQLHRCVEKEFRHRNEEMAQAVQKQQELLERLKQESAAKDGLTLELHTAEGEWLLCEQTEASK